MDVFIQQLINEVIIMPLKTVFTRFRLYGRLIYAWSIHVLIKFRSGLDTDFTKPLKGKETCF